MPFNYAVLGAGRQGTAAAYDMGRWGDAHRVVIADSDLGAARRAAVRVNRLLKRPLAVAAKADVRRPAEVRRVLEGVDSFLSAVPYVFNLAITRIAIQAGASMCDLGGHTGIARQQHKADKAARKAGISIVPNCGQVPGMGTSLVVRAMELLDKPVDVYMWDGGIPQHPRPPFNYLLTFHIAGLTNEYAEPAVFLRNGKITEVQPMTEVETVEFPAPIGTLEAFVTGGGTDTMPWTFKGKLRTLQNLTVRYPGHFEQLKAFHDLGLWSLKPVRVGRQKVVPRDVFHALYAPFVEIPGDKDCVVVRVKALGLKNGRKAESLVEVIDWHDRKTGFTAMERTTGWSAAIVAEMAARGEIPRGAGGVESQVPAGAFVSELRRRGMDVKERVTWPGK